MATSDARRHQGPGAVLVQLVPPQPGRPQYGRAGTSGQQQVERLCAGVLLVIKR